MGVGRGQEGRRGSMRFRRIAYALAAMAALALAVGAGFKPA
jgi:hypothetical protein